jgi:hypothetical protein
MDGDQVDPLVGLRFEFTIPILLEFCQIIHKVQNFEP